ncbi:TetR/AcrR family transcriptional regulator [Pseudonocardia sp. TRM90224]|uniref:TetR/AcrR family transcriptional regulator n=1 Tax=Pseudonocardia sp. TRM90224 TaxID=2812678 RepID=UPI0021037043|nr:TetR/AcrR family transcriptional regulator [Pseudonocardia sp. TRM90224]
MKPRTRNGQDLLTPAAVVDRALMLADAEGLGAVTIRRLAHELDVTPMALYWHFASKEELLDAMADGLLTEMLAIAGPVETVPAGPWRQQLAALLDAQCTVLRAHPSVAPLVWTRNNLSDAALRLTERMLAVLRRAGFSPTDATRIARRAARMTTALVAVRAQFVDGDGDPDRVRDRLSALPIDEFPRVVEAAVALSGCDGPDEHYGLELVLAGIEAEAARLTPFSEPNPPPTPDRAPPQP